MSTGWNRLPEIGPRRRCLWGGWRCQDDAVAILEPRPAKGRPTVLCDQHLDAWLRQRERDAVVAETGNV